MRSLPIGNTAVDLEAQVIPFVPNNSIVVLNLSGGNLTLQESNTGVGDWTTLATLAAGANNVTFQKQYVRLSTSATVWALGN